MYDSPAGEESVHVSVTLKNDAVTSATFTGNATNVRSKNYQEAFSKGFTEQVVGESIDQVKVGVVNGASLTGGGFMDALAKIKTSAKA
jgi:hypothetical protein